MKPENQVPTLETCKKLQEAGIEIDAYFEWVIGNRGVLLLPEDWDGHYTNLYPAPTAQELLEVMPDEIKGNSLKIENSDGCFETTYYSYRSSNIEDKYYCNENLAEALAQMLLWLKEE